MCFGASSSIGEIEGEITSLTSARGQVHLLLDFGLGNEPIECGSSDFDAMQMPEKTETAPAETDATPTSSEIQAAPSPGETPSAPTESAALTWTFTPEECQRYRIPSCP